MPLNFEFNILFCDEFSSFTLSFSIQAKFKLNSLLPYQSQRILEEKNQIKEYFPAQKEYFMEINQLKRPYKKRLIKLNRGINQPKSILVSVSAYVRIPISILLNTSYIGVPGFESILYFGFQLPANTHPRKQ